MFVNLNRSYFIAIIIIVSFGLYLNFYIFGGLNYVQSDAYYYISLSRSLIENGSLFDLTSNPIGPPLTPQNGIVFINSFLIKLGIDNTELLLYIVSTILYLNLLFIFYLLYGILISLNVSNGISLIVILSFSLTYYFYGFWLAPLNDGFFASLSLLMIYIILKYRNKELSKTTLYLSAIVIGLLISNFRIQGIFVFLSIGFSYLVLYKDYKKALLFLLISILGYFSMTIITRVFITDFSFINGFSKDLLTRYNVEFFYNQLNEFLDSVFFNVIFSMSVENVKSFLPIIVVKTLSIIILLLIIIIFLYAWYKKNFNEVLLSSYILLSFLSVLLFYVIDRYFYIAMPLIILLFVSVLNNYKRFQMIMVLLFFLISLLSISARVIYKNDMGMQNKKSMSVLNQLLKDEDVLIGENSRVTYFLFNRSNNKNFEQIKLNNSKAIFVSGRDTFIKDNIKKIDKRFQIINIKNLNLYYFSDGHKSNVYKIQLK